MLEKHIEKKVKDYARKSGWLVYKFTSPGHRSVPDDIFMKDGDMFFIEFKAPGKKPTPKQADEAEKIRNNGFNVYIIDNIGEGYNIVDSWGEV